MDICYDNFTYRFPEPQYLGAKYNLLSWIGQYVPKETRVVIDAFSGSQSVAYYFKQLGLTVHTNDFLKFNHQIGLGLVENSDKFITEEDITDLFSESDSDYKYSLIEKTFSDVFFETAEAAYLDSVRCRIETIADPLKKALAFTCVNRALTRKITMGHFGHTQALVYAANPERIRRNPNLIKPIKQIILELIPKYNGAVFDNKQENKSYQENILDLLPKLKNTPIDLIYLDPPYCDSHADYQSFYHLTETFTEYWQDKRFINGIKRYEPQRFSGFDKKTLILDSFDKLFSLAADIPVWLLSYNDRSYPKGEDLLKMIKKYKPNVSVETKSYTNSRGGKGSVAGSKELLFVSKDKTIY